MVKMADVMDQLEEVNEKHEVIGFNVDRGEYDSLDTEVLKVLAEAEMSLYPNKEIDAVDEDYWAV